MPPRLTPEQAEVVAARRLQIEAETKKRNDDIANIKSQVLNQWKQLGVPSIGGGLSIDERAQGLAERLYANQITDLANLKLVAEKTNEWNPLTARRDEYGNIVDYGTLTPFNDTSSYTPYEGGNITQNAQGEYGYYTPSDRSFLKYGDRQIGFLGDIGDAANWQPSGYLQPGNLASWGSQGKGAVGYTVQQAPNGQVYFIPSWGSTSDFADIAPIAAIGLSLLAPGAGTAIGSALGASGVAATALGNAVISGTLAEASGGDFVKGALQGAGGALIGSAVAPITSTISEAVGSQALGQALTGGALAEAQGGDFLQGALQGGISGAIDSAKLAAAEEYLKSIPPGATYESDLPTLNVDFEYPVQDFGVPIDTNTDFYTKTGATAYIPNDDGTMTYTWDDGSTITVDPSFNVVNFTSSTDTVFTPTEKIPEDISKKLSALDLAKALAPTVITAGLASKAFSGKPQEAASGFPILPVPADWKSPEYNMAFTPSAPIDFGTRELLRGTQFENPQITAPNAYSLSNLINTLNMGSVPFVQQNYEFNPAPLEVPDILQQFNVTPTVGMTDIIGNLNNQPVSISDIIAGIQSGQNYSI